MAPETPKKMNRLTMREAYELIEFLKQVCKPIPDTEYCEYLSPWDDNAVAAKLGVTYGNVKGARQAMFGKLKPAPIVGDPALATLRTDIDDVMAYLTRQDPDWRSKS